MAQTGQAPDAVAAQHQSENGQELQVRSSTIAMTLIYTSDLNADVIGGISRGSAYLQRIGLLTDADLERAIGWKGASAHFSLHAISGQGLSSRRVGSVLAVSGIEAEPAIRVFNFWLEQKLGNSASLRAGQFTAGQEFAISPTANLFVNSTFGWPASFATDLPSGGPAYPLSAPGLRLALSPTANTRARLAIFTGDPAGVGDGDPQRRGLLGLNGWRLKGKPFIIGEIARSGFRNDGAGSIILGAWVHLDRFNDLHPYASGTSLSPSSAGIPRQISGNWGIYAIADVSLFQAGSRSLRGFLRASASPSDRNAVDLYFDGGLSLTALVSGRPADIVGVAFAIARLSPDLLATADKNAVATGQAKPSSDTEFVLEASYQLQIRPGFTLQPNMQLVVNPSGQLVADPLDTIQPAADALVLGIRSLFRF